MRTYTSNSERSSALCEMRWLFRYGLGLEVPSDTFALSVGKAWHEVMEVYWLEGFQKAEAMTASLVASDKLIPMEGDSVGLEILSLMLDRYDAFHSVWIEENGPLAILGQEVPIERATQVNGRWSTASRWLGVIDKIVQDDEGRIWILEHKTTGLHPTQWLEGHRADYQPRIYAWLLRSLGLEAVGCIYDVVRRGGATEAKRNKDGSLAKIRKGSLPRISGDHWALSVTKEEMQIPWVREVFRGLAERDKEGYWMAREHILFEPGEVDRAAAEAHTVATRLRRHRKSLEPYRELLEAKPIKCPRELGSRVAELVRQIWGQFPRNVGECSRWGRMCEYSKACATPNTTTCSTLRVRAKSDRSSNNESATHRSTHSRSSQSSRKH